MATSYFFEKTVSCHCGQEVRPDELVETFQFINGEWVWVMECADCASEENCDE